MPRSLMADCPQSLARSPFRSAAALVTEGVSAFALGGIGQAFADRTHAGLPEFDLAVCAERPGMLQTDLGLAMRVDHGLDKLAEADLIFVLPTEGTIPDLSPALAATLRAAHRRGAIMVSFCSGAYLLAGAGLLDGRRATTHWSLADDFATRFPAVKLISEALYVDEGQVLTGAGAAAGIDLFLHLLRREHGARVAGVIAQEMLTAPHREGDQVQCRDQPVPSESDTRLTDVMEWARANLDRPASISDLAARALMSERTFARRFKAVTGISPYSWLLTQRLHRAQELLETTDLHIEEIARLVGFGAVSVFRSQFAKRHGISPRTYRQMFAQNSPKAPTPPPAPALGRLSARARSSRPGEEHRRPTDVKCA
jgi:transcriptional regulator GlxA family with amidase domain